MSSLITRIYRRIYRAGRAFSRGDKGVTLIETLMAIAILGIIGVSLLAGMTGVYRAVPIADEQEIGKLLARSQIETAMKKPYALSYQPAPIPDIYPGYAAEIIVEPFRFGNIQKITVNITKDGEPSASFEIYKTN